MVGRCASRHNASLLLLVCSSWLLAVAKKAHVSIKEEHLNEEKIRELAAKRVPVREECPLDDDHKSFVIKGAEDDKKKLVFVNANLSPIRLLWVGFQGEEFEKGVMDFGENHSETSVPGHVFNFRLASSDKLIGIFRVPVFELPSKLMITPCKGMEEDPSNNFQSKRWPEFERLAAGHAEGCLGPTGKWSCIRHLSPEELENRKTSEFGMQRAEVRNTGYSTGDTRAIPFDPEQQRYVFNFTDFESGYLKMTMPDKLKSKLMKWYGKNKDNLKVHEGVMHANHEHIDLHLVDLHDSYTLNMTFVRHHVFKEVQQILQWWTGTPLRHTKTMGVQVYRRGAMLFNHLDDTHTQLVSAVLQLSQKVDKNGGWPFEIHHPSREGATEVYLQPGEMLLYEGARLLHGRPMRFKGDEYVTVFCHFTPISWRGPDNSRPNPHHPLLQIAHEEL